MKLTHISYQSSDDKPRRFSEVYQEQFLKGKSASKAVDTPEQFMLQLIEHLEEHVQGAPQWIVTSHTDLVFKNRDFLTYEEAVDTPDTITLFISTNHSQSSVYEITYILPEARRPWKTVVGYADDVEVAGQMIAEALGWAAWTS